jgi:hypothetical protein
MRTQIEIEDFKAELKNEQDNFAHNEQEIQEIDDKIKLLNWILGNENKCKLCNEIDESVKPIQIDNYGRETMDICEECYNEGMDYARKEGLLEEYEENV